MIVHLKSSLYTHRLLAWWSFWTEQPLSLPGLVCLSALKVNYPVDSGCNVLLEQLVMPELLWTKRRHPKHTGAPGCHCRLTELEMFKHSPVDPIKMIQTTDIMRFFLFLWIKQVGTLDVLVGLSDELAKLDSFVERFVLFSYFLVRNLFIAHLYRPPVFVK